MTTNISGDYITFPDGARQVNANSGEGALTQFYLPSSNFTDKYRSGWLPSWFNQQWGGAQWGGLPDGSFGSVATGNVQDDTFTLVGSVSGQYQEAYGFKVSDTATYNEAWVKLYKVGNPTTITVRIWSDSAGSPSAAIGTAATLSGKLLTSKTDGEWYQVTGLAAALTAGTQYYIVVTQSATDASNHFAIKGTSSRKYPHGYRYDGTSGPVWTPQTVYTACFLIQNPAANSILQSGGMFDHRLSFAAGTPVNQSRSVAQPLINFFDGRSCSVLYRGTFATSSNVWDFTYGLDHDRITLTINSSGFPVLTVYRSDRTAYTVTGTGSVTTGNHDVGIRVRTVGDGSDYATLYVDGTSVGTPLTAQTFTMDAAMQRLGTARLGDGFGIIPAWTQDMQMTSLPSAQGWTWTGGTEADCMSIQGGKLYQNANGYGAAAAYYIKTTTFSNATGGGVVWKCRVANSPNLISDPYVVVRLQDGTNAVTVRISEYFLQIVGASATVAAADFTIQGDFKSQEHVFSLHAKGSDYYLYIDGKLAVDGTGKHVGTSGGANNVSFGDTSSAAANADAIWSYVKYYQGGMLLPTAATSTCSEFAHWSGDKSALYASLWNSGTPVSVKQLCGVPRNYQFEQVVQREVRRGVTNAPTTSSTTPVLLTDMECYVIGGGVSAQFFDTQYDATTGTSHVNSVYVDGVTKGTGSVSNPGTNYGFGVAANAQQAMNQLGLHKVETRWNAGSAITMTSQSTLRNLTVEARS